MVPVNVFGGLLLLLFCEMVLGRTVVWIWFEMCHPSLRSLEDWSPVYQCEKVAGSLRGGA
jgi:hypothetical protein